MDSSPSKPSNNVHAPTLPTRPLQGEEVACSNVIMKATEETKAYSGVL